MTVPGRARTILAMSLSYSLSLFLYFSQFPSPSVCLLGYMFNVYYSVFEQANNTHPELVLYALMFVTSTLWGLIYLYIGDVLLSVGFDSWDEEPPLYVGWNQQGI